MRPAATIRDSRLFLAELERVAEAQAHLLVRASVDDPVLILLDSLGPSERVAFLLGDVFGEPYQVIAEVLGKSEPACRQLVSRARRKVHQARLLGLKARPSRGQLPAARLLDVNSSPSLVLDRPEGPIVITAEALNGRITSIWVRLNPDKTAALQDPPPIV